MKNCDQHFRQSAAADRDLFDGLAEVAMGKGTLLWVRVSMEEFSAQCYMPHP